MKRVNRVNPTHSQQKKGGLRTKHAVESWYSKDRLSVFRKDTDFNIYATGCLKFYISTDTSLLNFVSYSQTGYTNS